MLPRISAVSAKDDPEEAVQRQLTTRVLTAATVGAPPAPAGRPLPPQSPAEAQSSPQEFNRSVLIYIIVFPSEHLHDL